MKSSQITNRIGLIRSRDAARSEKKDKRENLSFRFLLSIYTESNFTKHIEQNETGTLHKDKHGGINGSHNKSAHGLSQLYFCPLRLLLHIRLVSSGQPSIAFISCHT
ncbi:uncharacterized protein V6R79_004662 [Siganus canaliculatus]